MVLTTKTPNLVPRDCDAILLGKKCNKHTYLKNFCGRDRESKIHIKGSSPRIHECCIKYFQFKLLENIVHSKPLTSLFIIGEIRNCG